MAEADEGLGAFAARIDNVLDNAVESVAVQGNLRGPLAKHILTKVEK